MIEAFSAILQNPWEFIIQTLLAELIVVIVGVVIAHLVLDNYVRWRFGNWRVIVKGDDVYVDRPVSARKAQEVLEEPAELSVFLKGVVSPYLWIKCDIIEHGIDSGFLVVDERARVFVIDLTKHDTCHELTKGSTSTSASTPPPTRS